MHTDTDHLITFLATVTAEELAPAEIAHDGAEEPTEAPAGLDPELDADIPF